MNTGIKIFIGFAAGAAAGVGATYIYFRKKADKIIGEEREYYKNYYEDKFANEWNERIESHNDSEEEYKEVDEEEVKSAIEVTPTVNADMESGRVNYSSIIEKLNRGDYAKKEETNEMNSEPYIVNPQDFQDENGYDKRIVTYYADDGIFADADDYVTDIVDMVGEENLEHFGESGEDGTLYVRNDRYGIDFEIHIEEDVHYNE